MKYIFLVAIIGSLFFTAKSQEDNSLYCGQNHYRSWWNVQHYTLKMDLNSKSKSLKGSNTILANVVTTPSDTLQIDLQTPLKIKCIRYKGKKLKFTRNGTVHLVVGEFSSLMIGNEFELEISYSGKPTVAFNPPWGGGVVFKQDTNKNPWMAVACQGIGASVWWPCKDDPSDEPDKGVDTYYTTSGELTAVGNGRLVNKKSLSKKKTQWHWKTTEPINLYDVTFYIGDYVHWSDSLPGENGTLTLDYYVLRNNLDKAKKQFEVVQPMIECFEDWFGPYPFYADGFKLVESPYLGMEHQSAIAYGNEYRMGYLGMDRSMSGVGLLFDYIIVHESGHEWFGNNISIEDVAYSWIHEGFTTYSETIFAECQFGKEKAYKYQRGLWKNIQNDTPMEGTPTHCDGGSGDHYDKGAAMIHMIRMVMNDDAKFKSLLRGLNSEFGKGTVNGKDVENYINTHAKKDFTPLFDQYLRTTQIPELALRKNDDGSITYRWENCIQSFNLPILIEIQGSEMWLYPTTDWQSFETEIDLETGISVNENYYISVTKK